MPRRLVVAAALTLASACGSPSNQGGGYTIGGTTSGLAYSGLVLSTAGQPNLTVPALAATFTFANQVPTGTAYNVSIVTQPSPASCTVSSGTGSGTVGSADVTSIAITCTIALP